jgi:hypothetical protein
MQRIIRAAELLGAESQTARFDSRVLAGQRVSGRLCGLSAVRGPEGCSASFLSPQNCPLSRRRWLRGLRGTVALFDRGRGSSRLDVGVRSDRFGEFIESCRHT